MTMFSLQVIVPPQADPSSVPYRASTLVRRLRALHHTVRLDDDNQHAYDFFLDPKRLTACLLEAERTLNQMEEGSTLSTLREEYLYYRTGRALLYGANLPKQVEHAWSVLQNRGSSVVQREEAKRIVQHALEVAGLSAFPSLISLHDLNLPYSSESSEHCRRAAVDDAVNPYVPFWRERVGQIKSDRPDAVILWIEVDQQVIPSLTLARMLKEAAVSAEIVLAGPFARFISQALGGSNPWKEWIDTLACGPDLFSGITVQGQPLLAEGTASPDLWTVEGLPLDRYLGQPPVAVLPLAEDDPFFDGKGDKETIAGLYQRMRALSQSEPTLRFYLSTPIFPEWLCELARLMEADGFRPAWGSLVSYGTWLSAEQAAQLAAAGCEFLHFELKGFLGYPDQHTAKQQMTDSWRNARAAGCRVLLSLVFGHPLSDPRDFEAFVSFLNEHQFAYDRLVRFQLFRLTPGSRFWNDPAAYGIVEIGEAERERDLKRHFPFVSRYGVNSAELYPLAAGYIAGLKRRAGDLPTTALKLDDWAFRGEGRNAVSQQANQLPDEGGEEVLQLSPDVEARRFAYPFGMLEQRWRTFLIGQTPWPEAEPLQQSLTYVVYLNDRGKMSVVNSAVFNVIELCKQPVKETELLAKFPARQAESLRSLLRKWKKEGMVRVYAESAAALSD
jgi:hypothetical protein